MYELIPLPLSAGILDQYGGAEGLGRELAALGCQGVEAIWAGEPVPEEFPAELAVGWHLTFFTDWLDLYREDRAMLAEKYGCLEEARRFYGGLGADYVLEAYRADLERARAMGAKYVVFHVSDVSIEEGYTYRWRHTAEEVIDAAAEVVNALFQGAAEGPDLLLENLWWPGLTMTDPALTGRLLDRVDYPKKGLMLDTGHLMNANQSLTTQKDGVDYIHRMLDAHGSLCRYIRGLHFHQSLSGAYVRDHTGAVPPGLPTGQRGAVRRQLPPHPEDRPAPALDRAGGGVHCGAASAGLPHPRAGGGQPGCPAGGHPAAETGAGRPLTVASSWSILLYNWRYTARFVPGRGRDSPRADKIRGLRRPDYHNEVQLWQGPLRNSSTATTPSPP